MKIITVKRKTMLIRRTRGASLRYIIIAIVTGAVGGVYIMQPVRQELEKRRREREQQAALKAIEEAAGLELKSD